ncbi:tryptophan synthase subunit beta [Myroides sp. LJL119]
MNKDFKPTKQGYYGKFGGAFIPEMLYPNIKELQDKYLETITDPTFIHEMDLLLKDYVGRPTPLYYSNYLSNKHNAKIYLKREDLNHTGAHKINNTIGQVLLAKKLGKKHIIAETGAGQHGVATATVCALLGLQCTVYMGAKDMDRQKPNVDRMKMLGANVIAAHSGSKTLKDATNEAIRHWINYPTESHYVIGSVVGPHPYPDLVAKFQSIISKEIQNQLLEKHGLDKPDYVIACVGGGSNAMGAFYHFIDNNHTKLIAVEAAGQGTETPKSAASIELGKPGVIHGSLTYLMQDNHGQIQEPYSISAGLDYPGIGPAISYLFESNKIKVDSITDQQALKAALELSQKEGIIPALESAHALAYLNKISLNPTDIVVINLSGRGDKDLSTYQKNLNYEK